MPEFLNNPTILAIIAGFILMYVFQVVFKGPAEIKRKAAAEEYIGRLSDDIKAQIESAIIRKDKQAATELLQTEANIGLKEAQETLAYWQKLNNKTD